MAAAAVGSFYRSAWWRQLRAACLERDGGRCTAPGCAKPARVADHIKPRPHVPHPCSLDTLDNLRSLCSTHDAQVQVMRDGARRQGGRFKSKAVDADGWPRVPQPRG